MRAEYLAVAGNLLRGIRLMSDVDPFAPDLVPVRDLPKLLPRRRGGRKLHLSTIWRWVTHGYGPDHVRLPVVRIGANIFTTKTALRDWCLQLSPPGAATDAPRTQHHRRKASDRAAEHLESLGI
jgi:hypothetical protein